MTIDEKQAELPEAVPLNLVSPLWRFAALAGVFIIVALVFVSATLGIVVIGQNSIARTPVATPPPRMVAPAPVAWPMPGVMQPEADDLPYPTKQDLVEPSATEEPVARDTARQRFLDKGVDTYQIKGQKPDVALVSPDGQWLAYVFEGRLYGGPIDRPHVLNDARYRTVRIAAGLTQTFYAGADEFPAAGVPVWFADPLPKEPSAKPIRDGNYVCCFDASGVLRRFEVDETAAHESTGWADALFPFRGSPLVPVPKDEDKLVFVKSHATGKPGAPDESGVLLGDLATGRSRVIVPRSKSTWRFLSISPDGTRIAMVSDRDHETEQPRQWRVFVAGMEGGEPQPLTSADVDAGPVGWTSDGSGIVYARSQHPLPAENWENENLDSHTAVDLYFWDFGANRETRLSRGGGFFSPSVTESDELYYLTVVQGTSGPTTVLRHMTLVAAREFAANESETAARDQKAWQALLDEVLTKPYQGDLTSALTAQITDRFAKSYRERFKAEPPADLQQLHRLRLELAGFHWAAKSQADFARLLGVLEGECLVRQHGGRWNLAKGLRTDGPAVADAGEQRNPFAMALNPFAGAGAWLRDEKNALDLSTILHRAGGRSLVLVGDLSTAQPALDSLTDPDFASAEQLFRTGAAEPAEALLLKMLGKSQHAGNHVLVVQTARLLHEHGRSKAFRQVMEKECEAPLLDPWRYNLLGLARLQDDPRGAIDAFKYALRSDLRFEAGYLNLALAYERAGQPAKAHACLRHYQALMPAGKYTADAARRLTAWGEAPSN